MSMKKLIPEFKQPCRVKTCPLYGKPIANLALHVVKEHKMNMGSHDILAKCAASGLSTDSKDMKYRTAKQCNLPYCSKRGGIFTRFDKHIKSKHGLTGRQYDVLIEMHESFRTFIKKKPDDRSAKVEDFCPAMEEANPFYPVSPTSDLKIDAIGDKEYPKRRLRSFQVKSNSIVVFHHSEQVEILEQDEQKKKDDGVIITFDSRKVVVSKTHEEKFNDSILWPAKDGLVSLKLQCADGSYDTPFPVAGKNSDLRLIKWQFVKSTLENCLAKPLDYKCYLCSKFHRFDLMYKPQYTDRLNYY